MKSTAFGVSLFAVLALAPLSFAQITIPGQRIPTPGQQIPSAGQRIPTAGQVPTVPGQLGRVTGGQQDRNETDDGEMQRPPTGRMPNYPVNQQGRRNPAAPAYMTDPAGRTLGAPNGRFWVRLSAELKAAFLEGYLTGARNFGGATSALYQAAMWQEAAIGLDQIYRDPMNQRIPVADALRLLETRLTNSTMFESSRQQVLQALPPDAEPIAAPPAAGPGERPQGIPPIYPPVD